MMKRKAFSLIEVLIVMMLIGIITAAFFPGITNGVKMIFAAKDFTKHTFKGQKEVEQEIVKLNAGNAAAWQDKNVNLFGQTVPLKVKTFPLPDSLQLVLALSKERTFIPELPEVDQVNLTTSDHKVFSGSVTYKNNKAGKNWEENVEFCIYRWYLGDLSYLGEDFNVSQRSALSLIKEYNPIREDGNGPLFDKAQHFGKEDSEKEVQVQNKKYTIIAGGKKASTLSVVPNTKSLSTNEKTADQFWKHSLNLKNTDENNFTEEEMKELYTNKGIVFSVTPIAKETGLVGQEKFSRMLSLKYEDPSATSRILSLGIVEIPETVANPHTLDGVLTLLSKGETVSNQKFRVPFLKHPTNQEIGRQEVLTDQEGYAFFSQELDTGFSYRIRVEGITDSNLSVEGMVGFGNYDFKFIDLQSQYSVGRVVLLTTQLLDKNRKPVKGALVRYQVKNESGKIIHKSSIHSDASGKALLRTGQRKAGKYEITAIATTPSGQKLTIVNNFVIK